MCVQKSAHNVRTNLYAQMTKCAYKKAISVKYLTKSVIYKKLFDINVYTKYNILL